MRMQKHCEILYLGSTVLTCMFWIMEHSIQSEQCINLSGYRKSAQIIHINIITNAYNTQMMRQSQIQAHSQNKRHNNRTRFDCMIVIGISTVNLARREVDR